MYKVVGIYDDNTFTSARRGNLKYKIGTVTRPTIPNSKIFVFDKLEDARKFHFAPHEKVFICKVTNAIPIKTVAYSIYTDLVAFWSGNYQYQPNDYNVPQGTYGCDSCELLKKVDL
jgi:hypothetical protein